ncbi:hypothetical protein TRVL_02718 [Trypanosoma vivax]|nr:hypothetical protein TRVL_02718 [Trypanosoma vivax]
MGRNGVVREESGKEVVVVVGAVSFTFVEEKPSKLRRRFVSRPKGETDRDDYEADDMLLRVPHCLDAVFDLKASFFQVSLPQGSCVSFRRRTEAGRLVEPTRLLTGYR